MRWRTASPYGEAARRRILSLSVRVLRLPGQEPNLNLVSASHIDVANANKLFIANVVATIATCARGYEIEFLIGQLDGVSEIGHLLHVGLLSVFCQWRDCCNCCHVITSCKTAIWMHCRAFFLRHVLGARLVYCHGIRRSDCRVARR